ncbi:hypothetical protein KIPB_007699, partial [Kipferlia bialata]
GHRLRYGYPYIRSVLFRGEERHGRKGGAHNDRATVHPTRCCCAPPCQGVTATFSRTDTLYLSDRLSHSVYRCRLSAMTDTHGSPSLERVIGNGMYGTTDGTNRMQGGYGVQRRERGSHRERERDSEVDSEREVDSTVRQTRLGFPGPIAVLDREREKAGGTGTDSRTRETAIQSVVPKEWVGRWREVQTSVYTRGERVRAAESASLVAPLSLSHSLSLHSVLCADAAGVRESVVPGGLYYAPVSESLDTHASSCTSRQSGLERTGESFTRSVVFPSVPDHEALGDRRPSEIMPFPSKSSLVARSARPSAIDIPPVNTGVYSQFRSGDVTAVTALQVVVASEAKTDSWLVSAFALPTQILVVISRRGDTVKGEGEGEGEGDTVLVVGDVEECGYEDGTPQETRFGHVTSLALVEVRDTARGATVDDTSDDTLSVHALGATLGVGLETEDGDVAPVGGQRCRLYIADRDNDAIRVFEFPLTTEEQGDNSDNGTVTTLVSGPTGGEGALSEVGAPGVERLCVDPVHQLLFWSGLEEAETDTHAERESTSTSTTQGRGLTYSAVHRQREREVRHAKEKDSVPIDVVCPVRVCDLVTRHAGALLVVREDGKEGEKGREAVLDMCHCPNSERVAVLLASGVVLIPDAYPLKRLGAVAPEYRRGELVAMDAASQSSLITHEREREVEREKLNARTRGRERHREQVRNRERERERDGVLAEDDDDYDVESIPSAEGERERERVILGARERAHFEGLTTVLEARAIDFNRARQYELAGNMAQRVPGPLVSLACVLAALLSCSSPASSTHYPLKLLLSASLQPSQAKALLLDPCLGERLEEASRVGPSLLSPEDMGKVRRLMLRDPALRQGTGGVPMG